MVNRLTQAPLVRLNRVTREPEPALAASWTVSPDGRTWTLQLRKDVKFSDGTPFTAADVLFSFRALYDPKVASRLASSMSAGGPLASRAFDDHTVVITLPAAHIQGIALLDTLPIYPRHKLEAALNAGTFREAWSVGTPPAQIAGLGPFVLQEHVPGQKLVFGRNPNYWRKDDAGRALPYLDAIEIQIVPDQNAEVLRLQAGEVDLMTDHVRAEDLAALGALRDQGAITLAEAGVSISPEMLWLNLVPGAPSAKRRPWLQREELRKAISHAADRQAIVNTVFLGAGEPVYGPITPGHGQWYAPDLPRTEFDRAKARALLDQIGLVDRNGDGARDDASGQTARIAIITQKGQTTRERTAAVLQEQLRQVGLTIDIVATDFQTMVKHLKAADYDAILYGVVYDHFAPALDFWLSSGGFHVWHPGQATPATPWEAQIDALMRKQASTADAAERRRLFVEAQAILAAHLPILYFAAPKVTIATSARLHGATPSVLAPPVLWNADVLWLSPGAGGASKR